MFNSITFFFIAMLFFSQTVVIFSATQKNITLTLKRKMSILGYPV